MNQAVTIFLLVLLVSVQTPVGQLFKFPLLIEHYLKHQQQQGVSFYGFLQDHYAANHHDADLPEDEQLPFKNITFNSIGFAVVTPFINANAQVLLPVSKKVIISYAYTPQQHLASIFHPPKV